MEDDEGEEADVDNIDTDKVTTEEEESSATETDEAELKIKVEKIDESAQEEQQIPIQPKLEKMENVDEPEVKVKLEPAELNDFDIQAEIKRELDELVNAAVAEPAFQEQEDFEPMKSTESETQAEEAKPSMELQTNVDMMDSDAAQLFGALIAETPAEEKEEEAVQYPEQTHMDSFVLQPVKSEPINSEEPAVKQEIESEFQDELVLPGTMEENMEEPEPVPEQFESDEMPYEPTPSQDGEPQEEQETPVCEEERTSSELPSTPTKSNESAAEEDISESKVTATPFSAPSALVENQTPSVTTSLDGNVELSTKQVAQAAPSGIKIKINLFNKGPAAVSPTPPQPCSPPPLIATSNPVELVPSPVANLPTQVERPVESAAQQLDDPLLVPPPSPDEIALINKPRLIGRKLTVFPLTTKGVDASGLCTIM